MPTWNDTCKRFMYFMIYYKCFSHSELQSHRLQMSWKVLICSQTILYKAYYAKSDMFGPKRPKQKSVYQWSAALCHCLLQTTAALSSLWKTKPPVG